MLTPWKILIWTRFDMQISTMGLCIFLCIKGKIHLYSALYASSTQLCYTKRAVVQPRPQPKPAIHELSSAAIKPRVASVCRFDGLRSRCPCKYLEYYSLTNPGGMEGWVGLVGWRIADSLPTSGLLSATDGTQVRENPPAKDRHHNHWATPQMYVILVHVLMRACENYVEVLIY